MLPDSTLKIDLDGATELHGSQDATQDVRRLPSEVALGRATEDLHHALAFCSMSEPHITREGMIRKEAYLHAAARRFAPDHAVEDWLVAEREVDHWLAVYGMPRHFKVDGLDETSV